MSASRSKPKASSASNKKPKTGKATVLGVPSEDTVRGGSSRLCAFGPDGSRFVHVARAGASERIRVFDALSGRVQAEAVLDGSSRATCVKWLDLDLEGLPAAASTDAPEDGRKKRRKRKTNDGEDAMQTDDIPAQASSKSKLVGVGRADGSVALFSPSHGRIVRTLTHPQSSSSITTICIASDDRLPRLWTAAEDGKLRLWDARQNVLLGEWTTTESAPFTALACVSSPSAEPCLLAGHHGIRLLSLPSSLSEPDSLQGSTPITGTLPVTASLPGHATPISQLHYISTSTSSTPIIVSSAQEDRAISVWSLSSSLTASIALTAPVRSFSPSADGTHILAISTSDTLTVHAIPTSPETSGKKVLLLPASASFALQPQKGSTRVEIADAVFLPDLSGSLRIVRLVGGLKPIFDALPYIDPKTGTYMLRTVLKSSPGDTDALLPVSADSTMGSIVQRYTEPQRVAVLSGEADLADGGDSDHEIGQADGLLDTDLAELSLGQRLQATQGHVPGSSSSSEESSPEDEPSTSRRRRKSKSKTSADATASQAAPPPASTLTRTLIQALHSSDAGLLEQCLSHSSPSLIGASVARLPSQLALPLIDACVLRLARGARGSSGKGGGGGASAQRATVLVAWIRAVLGAHGGYLMSMPEAVARLAGLHGVMAERAKLRDGLEGLRGRLEMVEVQMAMRGRREEKKREEVKVTRYVEGESSDEENAGEDVEVEVGSEGSVEDVELGASEDSDEGSGSEFGGVGNSEDEDGSGSDDAGPKMNGFIDDEAEEWSEESGESDDE